MQQFEIMIEWKGGAYSAKAEIVFLPSVVYCQPLWTLVTSLYEHWLREHWFLLCFAGFVLLLEDFTCIVFWWSSPPSFSVPLVPFLFPTHTTYVLFYSLLFFPQKLTQLHWCCSFIDRWRAGSVQIFRRPTDVFFSHLRGNMDCIIGECFSVKVFIAKLSIKQVDTCSEWEFSLSELV